MIKLMFVILCFVGVLSGQTVFQASPDRWFRPGVVSISTFEPRCDNAVTVSLNSGEVKFAECYKPDETAAHFWREAAGKWSGNSDTIPAWMNGLSEDLACQEDPYHCYAPDAPGDSPGGWLVIITVLTDDEKKELYYARQVADAAKKNEEKLELQLLKNHHLLFPPVDPNFELREDGCGDRPGIAYRGYHITQLVASNPAYPSEAAATEGPFRMKDGAVKCREQFKEMRKRSVPQDVYKKFADRESYKPQ